MNGRMIPRPQDRSSNDEKHSLLRKGRELRHSDFGLRSSFGWIHSLFPLHSLHRFRCLPLVVKHADFDRAFAKGACESQVSATFSSVKACLAIDALIVEVPQCFQPDALDLFVVCVESGLGFNATVLRVAKELEVSHEELAKELDLVATQMRLGIDRSTALKGLATRTGLEEISGLVSLIDQSARFGTSIAETLRIYSEEFRDRRAQKAEEAAAKIGTKMIFPMVFCIWPSFFVVAIGPAVMMLIEAFSHMKH